jgi:uncharacterized membrane protein (UPF0127 family)
MSEMLYSITVRRTGEKIASRALLADGHLSRLKGLLGKRRLDQGEALIIRPCWSIHTWFMRFPLDVLFVDKEGRVRKIVRAMGPWRLAFSRGSADALEFEAGALDSTDLREGDDLVLEPLQMGGS